MALQFAHPLAQYLPTIGAGQYVGEFDPTLREWARQAPSRAVTREQARMQGLMREQAGAEEAWRRAENVGIDRPPASPFGLEAGLTAASFLPGAGVAELVTSPDPGAMEYFGAAEELTGPFKHLIPGAMIGSLFGTKKRHVWHGRGEASGKHIVDVGGSLLHGGDEVLTPNTSYTTRPSLAAGFTNVQSGTGPERLTRYRIKSPEDVRNIPPDEYLDIVTEHEESPKYQIGYRVATGGVRPQHRFPTEPRDIKADVALFSYPNMPAGSGGYAESEISAARNVDPAFQEVMEREYRERGAMEQPLVEKFHDPVLGRAVPDPQIFKEDIKRKGPKAYNRLHLLSKGTGSGPRREPLNRIEAGAAFADLADTLSDVNAAMGLDTDIFTPQVGADLSDLSMDHYFAVRALNDFNKSKDEFIELAGDYKQYALEYDIPEEAPANLRRAHGLMMLNRFEAMERARAVAFSGDPARTAYWRPRGGAPEEDINF